MGSFFGYGNFDILGEDGGYVTEEEARQMISDALFNAKETGAFDDTKIYSTYEDMISLEPVGRSDVLYILETDDDAHGTRYIWDGSQYVSIQDTLTPDEISDIVK